MSAPAPHTPETGTETGSPDTGRPLTTTGEPPAPRHDGPGTASINGSPVEVHEGFTLTDAVAQLTGREITAQGTAADGHPLGIAVAVDDTVVPRSLWATTAVAPGQSVEVVTAVQGG